MPSAKSSIYQGGGGREREREGEREREIKEKTDGLSRYDCKSTKRVRAG